MSTDHMSDRRFAASGSATIETHFNHYHRHFKEITTHTRFCFENRDWVGGQAAAARRLALYGQSIDRVERQIRTLLGERINDRSTWSRIKTIYADRIASRQDRELAETFFNSTTRRVFDTVGVDVHIEFVSPECTYLPGAPDVSVYRSYPVMGGALRNSLLSLLQNLPFSSQFAHLEKDAGAVAQRIAARTKNTVVQSIDAARDIFFRGNRAYVISRVTTGNGIIPLVLALKHPARGIAVDAVIPDEEGISILFSYTRAYFHVLTERPFTLVAYLKTVLPRKRIAELYTAIGYNKHGKTVLYRDILAHTAQCGEDQFSLSPGKPGLVMIVFNMPNDDLVIKVIRDRFRTPKETTRQKVLQKYELVFKHDRAGRLVEAYPFEHLKFERCWFSDDLMEQLLSQAARTVRLENDHVVIDHAYVQRRVTPLDIFLKQADRRSAEAVVVEYGNAIRDLAVSNIFPGDMLLKNFGVTRLGRVVFYDYDELSLVERCNFRKIPDTDSMAAELSEEPWYFVDVNDVFPEELKRFLALPRDLRTLFMDHHADLFDVTFWQQAQTKICSGEVNFILPYASRYRLNG